MPTIIIPTPLRKYTGQNREFKTDEHDLAGAIRHFVDEYPDVKNNLLDEDGNVRSFIKIYVEDDQVDPGESGAVELADDTEVSIVPAIAGGCYTKFHRVAQSNAK